MEKNHEKINHVQNTHTLADIIDLLLNYKRIIIRIKICCIISIKFWFHLGDLPLLTVDSNFCLVFHAPAQKYQFGILI